MTRFITLLLSVLASGALFAQSQQQIRDQIFGETDAVKKQAEDLKANVLAPESYKEAMDLYMSAVDTMEKGKDLDSVREDLAEAKGLFQRAVDRSQLARTTFTGAIGARTAAEKAEAAQYAARDWERAEQALMGAARTLEGGNLNKAAKEAGDAQSRYVEAETKAIAGKARAASR
jgi:OmpA-OmpF porin, OOP family